MCWSLSENFDCFHIISFSTASSSFISFYFWANFFYYSISSAVGGFGKASILFFSSNYLYTSSYFFYSSSFYIAIYRLCSAKAFSLAAFSSGSIVLASYSKAPRSATSENPIDINSISSSWVRDFSSYYSFFEALETLSVCELFLSPN